MNQHDTMIAQLAHYVKQLKSDNQSAYNPYKIKEINEGILNILEVLLTGGQSLSNMNQTAGVQPGLDPSRARVGLFQTIPPSPSAPIRSGDVSFVPGPPAGVTVGNQQDVEFHSGPGHLGNGGQKVEFYAGPASAPPPGGIPPLPVEQGGQRVEFMGGPPPLAQTPIGNTEVRFAPGTPPMNVEAGEIVPQPAYQPPVINAEQVLRNQRAAHADLLSRLPIPVMPSE